MLLRTLEWVIITPLGSAVDPDVYCRCAIGPAPAGTLCQSSAAASGAASGDRHGSGGTAAPRSSRPANRCTISAVVAATAGCASAAMAASRAADCWGRVGEAGTGMAPA